VRYRDFVAKGESSGVLITGGSGGDASSAEDFNPLWISEFKRTNAYEVWERTTDPMLFDIVEARHPCNEKPSVVADIGLRLQEGIQELKLEQQLAPAREAVARTISVGSTNFLKAVDGVRERWNSRSSFSGISVQDEPNRPVEATRGGSDPGPGSPHTARPLLLSKSSTLNSPQTPSSPVTARPTLASWGVGIGSFLSTRAPRFSLPKSIPPTLKPAMDSTESMDFVAVDVTSKRTLPPTPPGVEIIPVDVTHRSSLTPSQSSQPTLSVPPSISHDPINTSPKHNSSTPSIRSFDDEVQSIDSHNEPAGLAL